MAEADNAGTGTPESLETAVGTENRTWLGKILWDGPPPSVAHLRAYARGAPRPVAVDLPADLFDGLVDIKAIDVVGVPEGAVLGVDDEVDGLKLFPAGGHRGIANLTVKVTAYESDTGGRVTEMAAIRLEIEGSPTSTTDRPGPADGRVES